MAASLLLMILSVGALVHDGDVHDQPESKIVGGFDVDISKVPWQVSLQVNNNHYCGGSIISRQWVLTAAHCTIHNARSEMMIRIGSTSSGEPREFGNDISVIKTTVEMKLDHPVKAVALPAPGADRPPVGTELLVSGWGLTENKTYPEMLRAVKVLVRDYKQCKPSMTLSESTEICAGAPGKDSCVLDSGGPLVNGNLQVGIVSYGSPFCGSKPGIYTDVAAYRGWIETNTGV